MITVHVVTHRAVPLDEIRTTFRSDVKRRSPLRRSPMKRRKAKRWREAARFREVVLERDPVCRACGKAQSVDAHHIRNVGMGWRDHDPENGMGLCRPCHREIDEIGKETWARKWFGLSYAELKGGRS